MATQRLAIPSSNPGGLEAGIDAHFGHCDLYTIVDLTGDQIAGVGTLPPVPHVQGGCLAAVQHLTQNGVTALISGGMGMRPLLGFQEAGIQVFRNNGAATVGTAVEALIQGSLAPFSREFVCGSASHGSGVPEIHPCKP